MRKLLLTVGLLWLCFAAVPGCGGGDDDDLTPVAACKKQYSILCGKIFKCYDKETLDAIAETVGISSSDCRNKFASNECGSEMAKCGAGETFKSDKASQCLDGLEEYSCDDVMDEDTPAPSACDQVCQTN